jgi:hypothetical protein
MLRAIIVILGALSTCFLSDGHAQKKSKRVETPNERFERKGGRSISTETTVKQNGEVTAAIIAKGRDLQLYDQGGHFDCRRWTPDALKNGQENEQRIVSALKTARNFIWEHWQNKKRGYIRVTMNSVDCTSTSHIFIEPDAGGKWQIVWRIARSHAMMSDGVDDLPTIRRVEQKIKNGKATSLIFKDADGEKWQEL